MSAAPLRQGRGGETGHVVRVLVVGATSTPWSDLAGDVEADLVRLRRTGVEVAYRCTGDGPTSIRSQQDACDAAPYVVRTVVQAAEEGFDAVIVDCTEDPGVHESRQVVSIPVIGAGEALRAAIRSAPAPVRLFSGDELRTLPPDPLVDQARGAATIALGGTGHSHLAELFAADGRRRRVIDPLEEALERCIAAVSGPRHGRST